jgi:ABC-type antimicrobial peptide transport system permease subunit
MSNQDLALIITITIAVIGGIIGAMWGIVRSSIARLVLHVDQTMDEIKKTIATMQSTITQFQLDIAKNYCTSTQLQKLDGDNNESHSKFWNELSSVKQRMTEVETVQKMCKGCAGK